MDISLVQKEIESKKLDLRAAQAKHSSLNQIDMLSSEGNKLRETMNYLKGYIAALLWTLNGEIDHYDVE